MYKVLKIITILLFVALQIALLSAIGVESTQHTFIVVFIGILSVAILLAYAKLPLHHHEHLFEDITVAVWVPVGAVLTFCLNSYLHLGAVIAAGLVGVVASLVPLLSNRSLYLKQLPVALYCGAFVGMSSDMVATSLGFVLVAGLVTAVFLVLSKSLLTGVGGKLGTMAFGGVAITSFIYFLLFK
ncbi:hypothetical protein [Pustulibacterium marinum]|uniref:hypothetical protein n=1 Tax=Pustulibacterium marinum TaxID=1224947 RepID=UPI001C435329|nr:hypothetical protein [Pustulibacterium marinum]